MSDITVSSDIHTFMQSATNSAARDNLGVGDTDAVNHASLVLTGTAESSQFIGPLRGEVLFRGQASEAITKGQAVYVSGISGNTPIVSLADSSNSAKMPAFGLASSTVSTSQSVDIVTFGTLSAIDTSTYSLGATLYVNGSGSLSETKPTGESSLIQNIGKVQRVHATSGSIKVGGAGRTNDTPNLDENKIFIGNSSNAASTAAISTVIADNASSVKTSYESNSDTNAYTDSEKTKLAGIATGAEVNAVDSVNSQTGAVTLDADDIDDTATAHRFATAAQLTKLDGIETAATADQTGAEIKSLYEAESNTNAFTDAEKTKLSGIASGAEVNTVDSVNTQTGAVVLDADDISDSTTTNKFTTASDISKLAGIETGADVTDATNVSAAGAPIISSGAGTPSSTPSKVGDIYIDTTSDDAYIAVGTASASDWEKSNDGSGSGATNLSWTASTSTISSSSGTDATLTNADGTNAGLMSSSDKTKLDGIAAGAEVNAVDSVNTQTGAVVLDADDISDAATTNKFTTASDITKLAGIETGATADQTGAEIKTAYESESNTNAYTDAEKTKLSGIASGAEVNTVDSVNTQTGAVVLDADDISDAATTNKFTTAADISKLAGIEASADVTDTTNVTAAGALMDSEVTNLAQVKAFDSSDYATAAQGTTADSAMQDLSDDTTPSLGGPLDVAGQDIVTSSNGDIEIDPNGSGVTIFKGNATKGSGQFKLNCEANSHGVTIKGPPHSAAATYTLTLPNDDGAANSLVQSDGSGNLSFVTSATLTELDVTTLDMAGPIQELAVNTTSVTGSTALDPSNGTIQRLTFSGNVTFTDSLADGESITLHIDDGTAYTATWPTMEWVGGSAPTLDTTNEHIIVIWKVNSTLYGMASGVAS